MLKLLLTTFWSALLLQGVISSGGGGYDYETQDTWGDSCIRNTGSQSPIDISTPDSDQIIDSDQLLSLPDSCKNITLHRKVAATTIKFSFPDGTELKNVPILEKNVTIQQLHVHWGGSEHMVNGVRYAMESHLVTTYIDHRDEDKIKIVVFARLFIAGKENPAIEKLISTQEEKEEEVKEFDAFLLYPSTIKNVFVYSGSLTTPPCSEGVFWTVVEEPLTVSRDQLKRLKDLLLGENSDNVVLANYRSPQDVNGRDVKLYSLYDEPVNNSSYQCYLSISSMLSSLRTLKLGEGEDVAKTFNWRKKQDTNDRVVKCIKLQTKSSSIKALASPILLIAALIKLVM